MHNIYSACIDFLSGIDSHPLCLIVSDILEKSWSISLWVCPTGKKLICTYKENKYSYLVKDLQMNKNSTES